LSSSFVLIRLALDIGQVKFFFITLLFTFIEPDKRLHVRKNIEKISPSMRFLFQQSLLKIPHLYFFLWSEM